MIKKLISYYNELAMVIANTLFQEFTLSKCSEYYNLSLPPLKGSFEVSPFAFYLSPDDSRASTAATAAQVQHINISLLPP